MADNNTPFFNKDTWIRGAYMVLFVLLLIAARIVVTLIVAVQFIFALCVGTDNENLRNLGQGLGKWIYQSVMFLTFNTEKKPFPFDEWPTVDPSEGYSVQETEHIEDAEYVEAEPVDDEDVPSFASKDNSADKDKS